MLSLLVMAAVCMWPAFPTCTAEQAYMLFPSSSSTLVRPSPTLLTAVADGNVVSEQVPLSIYVIADLDTEDGLSTLQAALAFSVRQIYPCQSLN